MSSRWSKGSQGRFLHQSLGIPEVASQTPTVAVKRRAMHSDRLEIADQAVGVSLRSASGVSGSVIGPALLDRCSPDMTVEPSMRIRDRGRIGEPSRRPDLEAFGSWLTSSGRAAPHPEPVAFPAAGVPSLD